MRATSPDFAAFQRRSFSLSTEAVQSEPCIVWKYSKHVLVQYWYFLHAHMNCSLALPSQEGIPQPPFLERLPTEGKSLFPGMSNDVGVVERSKEG